MDSGEFIDYLHVRPDCRHVRLAALAREYHERCETYDRTVCSGRVDRFGVVYPANPRELGLINVHAAHVWRETLLQGKALGFAVADVQSAIRKAA